MKHLLRLVPFLLLAASSWAATTGPTPRLRFYLKEGPLQVEVHAHYPTDRISVRIDQLKPLTRYRLISQLTYGAVLGQSEVDFVSDRQGTIRTDRDRPVSGSYDRVDPDGAFWSMSRLAKAPRTGASYHFLLQESGTTLQTAELPALFLRPGVETVILEGTGLVGALYLPASPGPHPAIITFGGSEGGTGTGLGNGGVLANAGYVALGLGYFGAEGLPPALANIPLEYFAKAIAFLQSRPEVLKDRIGVMGVSRGGELALLLGSLYPQLKAVVAQVPSPIRWAANVADNGNPPAAWNLGGLALPYIADTADPTPITLPDGRTAYSERPAFEQRLRDPRGVDAAFTEIEKINGPIFMYGGEDDLLWPSCEFVRLAARRLGERGHPFADEALCYPGAGHSVGLPPLGSTMETTFSENGYLMALGGNPTATARGQRDSWNRVLRFLAMNLR